MILILSKRKPVDYERAPNVNSGGLHKNKKKSKLKWSNIVPVSLSESHYSQNVIIPYGSTTPLLKQ